MTDSDQRQMIESYLTKVYLSSVSLYLRVLVVQQVYEVGHCRGILDHETARRRVRAHEVKHVDNLKKLHQSTEIELQWLVDSVTNHCK